MALATRLVYGVLGAREGRGASGKDRTFRPLRKVASELGVIINWIGGEDLGIGWLRSQTLGGSLSAGRWASMWPRGRWQGPAGWPEPHLQQAGGVNGAHCDSPPWLYSASQSSWARQDQSHLPYVTDEESQGH